VTPEPTLFDAFVAGFAASGEGFNGEYVGRRFRDRANLLFRLQEEWRDWMSEVGPPLADAEGDRILQGLR
jgi:hypothetical protein